MFTKDLSVTLVWRCKKCGQQLRKRVTVDLDMARREAFIDTSAPGPEFWEHPCKG